MTTSLASVNDLADLLIRRSGWPVNEGWHIGKCPLCNDYKIRAGFIADGPNITYNCWNCSTTVKYIDNPEGIISYRFRSVLLGLGVSSDEIREFTASKFYKSDDASVITLQQVLKAATPELNLHTPTIEMPETWIQLGKSNVNEEQQIRAIEYLISRNVDPASRPFFIDVTVPKLKNHVIIPYYRNRNLIFWQARNMNEFSKERYQNYHGNRQAVIFGYDELYRNYDLPLLVCEGIFDALMYDGISLLGSSLNEYKQKILAATTRKLFFILDKDSNGKKLGEKALSLGYNILFPPGNNDLNSAVQQYGKIWTIHEMIKNSPKDKDEAYFQLNLYCN